jgi:predicted enzyme related to lactoylglutathione lyase
MIQRLSHTSIYVLDQDAARDFYVNKLGFDIHLDQSMENGCRWLTVSPKGQPDFQFILMQVDDCQATYQDLKAKGVEFLSPPAERFYGIECVMKDSSNNWFSITQPK